MSSAKRYSHHEHYVSKDKREINLENVYLISLINMTDWPVEYVVVIDHIPAPGEHVNWVHINPIGRTSNLGNQHQFFDQGKSLPLVSFQCGTANYVGIAWKEPDGKYYAGFTSRIQADCDHYLGTVITLTA